MPEWLVSSPHTRRPRRAEDPASRPYGLHHARRVGDRRTACGLYAGEWPYFWDLPFGAEPNRCCPDCVLVLRESTPAEKSFRTGS
jgi:hypothetical protein